jgi:hypothetical protein
LRPYSRQDWIPVRTVELEGFERHHGVFVAVRGVSVEAVAALAPFLCEIFPLAGEFDGVVVLRTVLVDFNEQDVDSLAGDQLCTCSSMALRCRCRVGTRTFQVLAY